MCGIAGFFGLQGDKEVLQKNIDRMLNRIVHRGPDAQGVWIDPQGTGIVLGHRRLSIIDLTETGSQPMLSHSGRYVISYNGEIYNCRDVIKQMHIDGYKDEMYGTSDTEILIEAMEFYGPVEAIKKCKGMFAIALYDRNDRSLMLIRDRIGEKPLYYGIIDGAFVFASEVSQMRVVDGFAEKLNHDCICDFLKYGYIPAPFSIYKDIFKLEPGCALKIKCKLDKTAYASLNHEGHLDPMKVIEGYEPELIKYWSITDVSLLGQKNIYNGSFQEASDDLEDLLKASISNQMMSDVPLGAFLSAGIDSATVVALMQSISSRPVKTFTIGFEDKEYNEADAASEIAKHLGTEHTELYVTKQDALDVIPKIPYIFGEPFADSSQIPTYLVSKMTREHVTVSLSGDGGDELFAGYRDYVGVNRIYNKIKGIPTPLRNITGMFMENIPLNAGPGTRGWNIHAHGTLMRAKNAADLYRRTYEIDPIIREDKLIGEAVMKGRDLNKVGHICKYDDFNPNHMGEDAIHTAMLMNMNMYHPDDILCKVDRTAMAVSLETRVPMLDKDVVEFAWKLPLDYLRNEIEGKLILRNILYKYVPKEMMDRPKKGFGVPISQWLREDGLKEWASQLLNQESINRYNILDYNEVQNIWTAFVQKGIWRPQIWYMLMLQSWLENRN